MNNTKRLCVLGIEHVESVREALNEAEQMAWLNAIIDFVAYGKEPSLQGAARVMWVALAPFYRKQRQDFENGLKGAEFGKFGGAPKGNQNARKQPPNNPQTTPKQPQIKEKEKEKKINIKEKTIADAIVEDNNSNSNDFNFEQPEIETPITELYAALSAETIWVEALCTNLHKDLAYIQRKLEEFCTEQQLQGVTGKPISDAKRHFRYWLKRVEETPTNAPTSTAQPYRVITYADMLARIQQNGGSTNDYAPLRVEGVEKPLWVTRADKQRYNIPDRVAEMPQISTMTPKRWS